MLRVGQLLEAVRPAGPVSRFLALSWFILTFTLGLILSIVAASQTRLRNDATFASAISEEADRAANTVVDRLSLYQFGLRGARGAIVMAGVDNVTRASFHRYAETRDIDYEFPGARGFGFIRIVPRDQLDEFVAHMRTNGIPGFSIRHIAPHEGDLFPIVFVEPLGPNAAAVGLDIASETNRRTAAEEALRTGMVRLTAPITLVQQTGLVQQSSLILLPVYSTGETPPTERERIEAGVGWTYAPLAMPEVMARLEAGQNRTALEIWDETSAQHSERIFGRNVKVADVIDAPYRDVTREIFGRRWRIRLTALPAFEKSLNLSAPENVLGGGMIASLLIAALVGALGVNRQKARELAAQQSTLAAIVKGANDAIIAETPEGIITAWNEGATRMFGLSAQEALGRPRAQVISYEGGVATKDGVPEDWEGHFNTRLQRSDGSLLDLSIAVSAILDEDGARTGQASTIRDISREKEVEQRIRDLNSTLENLVAERTADLESARRMLRTVLDAVPSMIGYWDRDLINQEANKAYHDWFGLPAGALHGKRMQDVLCDGIFEENRQHIESALKGETVSFERQIRRPFNLPERHALIYYLPDVVNGEVRGIYIVIHDVSELVDARLRLSTALLEKQLLLDTINEQFLYSLADADGTITDVNSNFVRHSGYQRREIIGQNYRMFSSSTHSADFWREVWRCVQSGSAWHGDILNRTKDGRLRWLDTVIAPFIAPDGTMARYIALQTDVTARKQAEGELGRLNDLLRNILNAASDVSIIATDPQGIIMMFNTGAERMLGYTAEEMVGKSDPTTLHLASELAARGAALSARSGHTIEGFRALVHEAELGTSEAREWTYVRKDGSRLFALLMVTAMRGAQGTSNGYLVVATDITASKRQMEELTTTRDQLVMAAAVARIGIWTWLIDEGAIIINDYMIEIYGLPKNHPRQMSYAAWKALVHPEDIEALEASIGAAVVHGATFEAVFRILRRDEIIYVHARGLTEMTGGVRRMIGVNRDITEQRELEATLRHAKEEADAASAAKSTFIANISHEFRTPMNAVIGMLELVKRTELSTRQLDYIQKAQSSAASMLVLLNDVMDFSKASAGMMRLDVHEFDTESLFYELSSILSGSSQSKDVEVILDIDPAIPETLIGDRVKLLQIMVNLSGNALKFTDTGIVEVRVDVIARDGQEVRLRLSVIDTGIGISPLQRDRIFEGFVQAEVATSRRYGGTGLGLFICKKLVDLMGGQLQLDSELGRGSRFWFDIPLALGIEKAAPIRVGHHSMRVLVVDDMPQAVSTIERALTFQGYSVSVLQDAARAIAWVRESVSQNLPVDLVLMDLRMPGIDGLTAATALHTDNDARVASIPIILVTAFSHSIPIREASERSGIVDVLTKPFSPRQLTLAVENAIAGTSSSPQPRPASAAPAVRLAGIRLLVVEDNAINRQVASELLSQEGALVTLATGGLEGVAAVLESGASFDVVLMDVQMPDFDGLDATRSIRANSDFDDLPIIAMTANVSQADRDICRQAGMDYHVGKPLDINLLVDAVTTAISSKKRPSVEPLRENLERPTFVESEVESREQVLQRFGGTAAVYSDMYDSFYNEIKRLADVLDAQIAASDALGAAATLHIMQGVSSTMGAVALAGWASAREAAVRADADAAIPDMLNSKSARKVRRMLTSADVQLRKYMHVDSHV